MPSAASRRSDPGASERGEAHHPACQELTPATVGPAWLRVCAHHPGGGAESPRPPLQQLQRPVPEHLSEWMSG